MTFHFKSGDIHIKYVPESGMCNIACSTDSMTFSPNGNFAKSVDNLISRLSDLEEGELLSRLVAGNGEYSYTLHGYSDSVWEKIRGY
jgi:hypothetical protein